MSAEEQWATVELMGRAQSAGRIEMENGLLRVDVPLGDTYRTEYYGLAAIYAIKIVSEEIARAYATGPSRAVVAYDTPIVTREQHRAVVDRLEQDRHRLIDQVRELESRLIKIEAKALPEPEQDDDEEEDEQDHEYGYGLHEDDEDEDQF